MKTNKRKTNNERDRRCFDNCIMNIEDDFPLSFHRVYYNFRYGKNTNIYKLRKNTDRDSFINFIAYDQVTSWRLQKAAELAEDKITKGDIKKYSKLESKLIPILNFARDVYEDFQYTDAEILAQKRTCSDELERIDKLVWKFQDYIDNKCAEIYINLDVPKGKSYNQMQKEQDRIRKIILSILELKSHTSGMYYIPAPELHAVLAKKAILSEILYSDYPRQPKKKNNDVDHMEFMEKYIFPSKLAYNINFSPNEDSSNENTYSDEKEITKNVNYIYGFKYTMSDELAEKIANIFDVGNIFIKKIYLFAGVIQYKKGNKCYSVVADDLESIVPMENMVLSRITQEIHGCNIDYETMIDLRNQIKSELSAGAVITVNLYAHALSEEDIFDKHTMEENFIAQTSNLVFFRQMQKRSYDHFRKIMDDIHLAFINDAFPKKDESKNS